MKISLSALPLSASAAVLLVALLPAPSPAAAAPPSVSARVDALSPTHQVTVPRCAKFEASWTLPHQTGNPFDPQDNDITVAFAGPRNARAMVPAFWDGDRWRVRFAPAKVGTYTLRVLRAGQNAVSIGLSARGFVCVLSTSGGFVRASSVPAPHFALDNGQSYYPLGMDVAWTGDGEPAYPDLLRLMSVNGLNWARIWMNHWDGKNLDWAQDKAQNPKRGYLLLDVARKWDSILDNADRDGVYVQMTLQNHGQYTTKTDPNWADNPWNVANGGFLAQPDDFFTNPEARRLTKAKYRYIVARYGYCPHLLAFELFNEVQNIGEAQPHFADVLAWHKEMAAYIRSLDTNHHLITSSYSDPGSPLAQIGLDYNQIHAYPPDIVSYFAALNPNTPTPTFVGEWGYDNNASLADKRAFLHDGLWASLTAPTAGAGQFWYGDAVVANNWWPELQSAAAFVQKMQVAQIPAQMSLAVAATAPSSRADLSFAPPGGWGPTTRTLITLPSNGGTPDLSGVSSYLQGTSHRDLLPRPIVFSVRNAQPAAFRLEMGTVAAAGAHLVVTLDGKLVQEQDFAPAPKDHDAGQPLVVPLSAGAHEIGVFNTGSDWIVIKRLVVTNYVPPVAALARGTSSQAVFWAHLRPGGVRPASGASLTFPSLAPGAYTVRLWDIARGLPLPSAGRALSTRAVGLAIALPPFAHDIAGVAVRR